MLVKAVLCPIREKPGLLEIAELKDNRDPAERLVLRDLPDLLEHRFVCHYHCHTEPFASWHLYIKIGFHKVIHSFFFSACAGQPWY